MSRRKKPRKSPPPALSPSRGWVYTALGCLVALAVVAVAYQRIGPTAEPPAVDFAEMEPQVAAYIRGKLDAVAASPRSAEAWGELGVALQAHSLDREASPCYQQAIALDGDEFRWHYLLVHSLRASDAEAALVQTRVALAVESDYAPLHIVRGELLEERGAIDEALQHYRVAVELDPDNPMAAFGVGRLLLARGEVEGALALLELARELDPEAGAIRASLAQALRRAGERERAVEEARAASERRSPVSVTDPIHFRMRQESVSSLALLDRARRLSDDGDLEGAERLFRELVRLRPDDADMRVRFGDVLWQLSRSSEARSEYEAALAINPGHAGAHYGLGNVLNLAEEYEQALSHYRRAVDAAGDNVAALVNLASLLAFRGDVEQAEQTFRAALDVEPEAFAPNRQLGNLLLQQRRFSDAIACFRVAVAAEPDAGPVHLSLALALASSGDFDGALEHVRRARSLGVEVPERLANEVESRAKRG